MRANNKTEPIETYPSLQPDGTVVYVPAGELGGAVPRQIGLAVMGAAFATVGGIMLLLAWAVNPGKSGGSV